MEALLTDKTTSSFGTDESDGSNPYRKNHLSFVVYKQWEAIKSVSNGLKYYIYNFLSQFILLYVYSNFSPAQSTITRSAPLDQSLPDLTQEMMMTSRSEPWYPSTVFTSISLIRLQPQYFMSKKSCPLQFIEYTMKIGQNFLDILAIIAQLLDKM